MALKPTARPHAGRPKLGENRLRMLAGHGRSEPVRLLLTKASEQFNVEQFARVLQCDKKTLYGYVDAVKPRLSTVEKLCKALGRKPIYARALMGRLTQKDCSSVKTAIILVDYGTIQLKCLFTDPGRVRALINEGLRKIHGKARVLALADYLLAREGLRHRDSFALPPELAALNTHLKHVNCGFEQYARPMTIRRQRDGLALLRAGLLELAQGSASTRAVDALVEPRVSEFTKTATFSNVDPANNARVIQRFETAFALGDLVEEILTLVRDRKELP